MATNMKLADVEVGTPTPPREFDNETQQYVDLDPRDVFLDRLNDRTVTDWQTGRTEQSLFLRHTEIPEDASIFHRNYLEYLEKCWGDHLGIVITPDVVWFTVLSELVAVVKRSPEPYRHLFTDSHEKKEIWVESKDPVVVPLNRLVQALRQQVPTDATMFLPDFSTTTEAARHAMYASFCDLCSPYYDYCMLLCGFPAISVQGDRGDWQLVAAQWRKLTPLFSAAGEWIATVQEILDNCVSRLEDNEWWKQMFMLERCGSGHQTEVSGWFSELFREGPRGPRYVENFPTNVAQVDYKETTKRRKFRMQDGLFFSRQEGDFMVPEFGYTVHEKLDPVITEGEEPTEEIATRTFNIENTGTRTLPADVKVETGETVVVHSMNAVAELEVLLKKNDE